MEQKANGGKALKRERQRKFLLFLPVIVVPFMTLLLWSAGIVGGAAQQTAHVAKQTGFNFHLPAARQAKDSNWNKMQYYAQADKDSERLRSLMRSNHPGSGSALPGGSDMDDNDVSGIAVNTDPKERLIEEKIAALNKKLNEPASAGPEYALYDNEIPDRFLAEKQPTPESMRQWDVSASAPAPPDELKDTGETDPELEKLDRMLDKVLDIQHPGRVQQQLQQQSEKNKRLVYPVVMKENRAAISLLQTTRKQHIRDTASKKEWGISTAHRFFGLNDHPNNPLSVNTVAAEIPERQVLVNGATVKLRLLGDVYIRGTLVPKNQLLYGVANLQGERLNIAVRSIGFNGEILPVNLQVFDLDGQQGLYIPGAITRDVAKQSADQGIETMNFGTYDASLGAQAASAGIQAAKQLIGKKVKLVKVTVRSGYKVRLRDMNNKTN